MRVILIMMASMALAGIPHSGAWGDIASELLAEQRAIVRLQVAAKQRYFVQSVAKSGCFALTAHNPKGNAEQASRSITNFDRSNEILISGDSALDLGPEEDEATLQAIVEMQANWQTFSAATRQIASGDWHSVPIAQVLRLNPVILDEVGAAVQLIMTTHTGDLATQKKYAATINIAGRQRMLVQKAAKEICFIALDIDTDRMRETLLETIDTFEVSLYALENGDYDMSVIDPPSLAVLVKVSEVRALWDSYRATIERITQSAEPSFEDVAFVEQTSEPLYQLSDELVGLYIKK